MPPPTLTSPDSRSASITPRSASIRSIVPAVIAASVNECPEPATLTLRSAAAARLIAAASSSRLAGRATSTGRQD